MVMLSALMLVTRWTFGDVGGSIRQMCRGYHERWRLFQMFYSGLIWGCCRMPIGWCY